jgi:hypothetical protein
MAPARRLRQGAGQDRVRLLNSSARCGGQRLSHKLAGCDRSVTDKIAVTLPGTVEEIIPPIAPAPPEKAQIRVDGAEDLYQEIRIENKLLDEVGNTVALKKGDEVEVTIRATSEPTTISVSKNTANEGFYHAGRLQERVWNGERLETCARHLTRPQLIRRVSFLRSTSR